METRKPVLYLDVVGTLLLDRGGRLDLAPFARSFMQQVARHFTLRFLTALQEYQALTVARALGTEVAYVPYPRALGKASVIDFAEDFYWLDDDPVPADLLKLADERCSHRLIPVSRREGVTEKVLSKLLVLAGVEGGVLEAT